MLYQLDGRDWRRHLPSFTRVNEWEVPLVLTEEEYAERTRNTPVAPPPLEEPHCDVIESSSTDSSSKKRSSEDKMPTVEAPPVVNTTSDAGTTTTAQPVESKNAEKTKKMTLLEMAGKAGQKQTDETTAKCTTEQPKPANDPEAEFTRLKTLGNEHVHKVGFFYFKIIAFIFLSITPLSHLKPGLIKNLLYVRSKSFLQKFPFVHEEVLRDITVILRDVTVILRDVTVILRDVMVILRDVTVILRDVTR